MEFDDAEPEEYQDMIRNDRSAFMVSKANISKYHLDRTENHEQTGAPIVPNKILDSMMLRESEVYDKSPIAHSPNQEEIPLLNNHEPEEVGFEEQEPGPLHRSTEIEKKKNENSVSNHSRTVSPNTTAPRAEEDRPSEAVPVPPEHLVSEPMLEPESPKMMKKSAPEGSEMSDSKRSQPLSNNETAEHPANPHIRESADKTMFVEMKGEIEKQ